MLRLVHLERGQHLHHPDRHLPSNKPGKFQTRLVLRVFWNRSTDKDKRSRLVAVGG